ncbi:MAG: DUF983 domain-containing protein [Vicingaceae bacterium]
MIKPGQKLYSILHFKCPRCHKGDVFTNQHPYGIRNFFDMPAKCSNCGLKYEAEPGFFYGAMYVSYALSIIISGLVWFVLNLFNQPFWIIIWTVIPALIISIPPLFKISRVIWLNFFVSYKDQE